KRVTVSEVERGRRNVTVPELLALALIFGATVTELLDPRRPDQRSGDGVMMLALSPDAVNFPIVSSHIGGLMCRHEMNMQPVEFLESGLMAQSFTASAQS